MSTASAEWYSPPSTKKPSRSEGFFLPPVLMTYKNWLPMELPMLWSKPKVWIGWTPTNGAHSGCIQYLAPAQKCSMSSPSILPRTVSFPKRNWRTPTVLEQVQPTHWALLSCWRHIRGCVCRSWRLVQDSLLLTPLNEFRLTLDPILSVLRCVIFFLGRAMASCTLAPAVYLDNTVCLAKLIVVQNEEKDKQTKTLGTVIPRSKHWMFVRAQ